VNEVNRIMDVTGAGNLDSCVVIHIATLYARLNFQLATGRIGIFFYVVLWYRVCCALASMLMYLYLLLFIVL
jgi:hypothetical protein